MQSHARRAVSQPQVSIFETVRDVPLDAVIQRYAQTRVILKAGHMWLLCPFHQDRKPSLSVKGQYWKCFGCGAGGDGVEFVARLHNMPKIQAAKQIASDFGIAEDSAVSENRREAIKTAKKARQAKKDFEQEVERAYQQMCDVRIECCKAIDGTGEIGLRYASIPDMLDTYLDILQFGTDEEKRAFLQSGIVQHWVSNLLPKARAPS